jgi:type II secretory pathway component GspD/PulD (secretin)
VAGRTSARRSLDSQTPVLGDIPYVGKLLFSRMQETQDRVTLLIFLTGAVVRD